MSIWADLCRSGIPADDTNAICRSEVNRCRFAMRKGVVGRYYRVSQNYPNMQFFAIFATALKPLMF